MDHHDQAVLYRTPRRKEALPMDPIEALKSIRTPAWAAGETDESALIRKHLEMIETIVEKALKGVPKRR